MGPLFIPNHFHTQGVRSLREANGSKLKRLEQTSVIAPKQAFVPPDIQLPRCNMHPEKKFARKYPPAVKHNLDFQFGWSFCLLQSKGKILKLI